ncbi:MAG: DinB family protein [Deinococcales bacterium]
MVSAAPYIWGSEALAADKGITLTELLAALEAPQTNLLKILDTMSEAELAKELKSGTLAEQLEFMAWHEGYHIGQLGLLRRLVGREGAV